MYSKDTNFVRETANFESAIVAATVRQKASAV
jgi:hypothetical protein